MRALTELEAKELLRKYKIPVTRDGLATSEDAAVKLASKFGYPVVAKIASREILHKTEADGVRPNLHSAAEVRSAFLEIMKSARAKFPKAKLDGISIHEQAAGVELLAGLKRDPQFGPVLAFGLGGIYVEVLQDVTLRVLPVTREDVREMFTELKGAAILDGVRGAKGVDKEALTDVLLALGKLAANEKNLESLDINPLFASEKGVVAADARVLFE